MIPSILANQLQKGVEDFLRTTFPIATSFFHGIIDTLLAAKEGVFKGPYLSIQLPFRKGDGSVNFFPDIEMGFTPYLHQERAFERISGPNPRSTIVATGTGSGKTECFLYPILDHCYRHRGEPGIKAILIYPMNALATDQAGRIARTIFRDRNLKGNVTAGLFVGQNEKDPQVGMSAEAVISHKDTLRHSPPDILLTNYKMLDYLLVRARDYPLWRQNGPETLRYLVVDELHTFDGAQGTDLACLLRRLKARLGTPKHHLCCVGTSATLGAKEAESRLLRYAAEIFGEPVDEDAVIAEFRMSAGEFLEKSLISRMDIPSQEAVTLLDPESYNGVEELVMAQYRLWFNEEIPPEAIRNGEWRTRFCDRLKGHHFFQNLLKVLHGGVRSYEDILEDLERVTPALGNASAAYRQNVLNSLAALVSAARTEEKGRLAPFLNVRHHLWLRELRRMVCRVSEKPELRFADDLNDAQLRQHLPLVHCRECGSMGWAGVKRPNDPAVRADLQAFYIAFFGHDPNTTFIFPDNAAPEDIPAEGACCHLCPSCIHLTPGLAQGDCPNCGHPGLIRVFVPNTRVPRRGRMVGVHDCPYCGAANGLTILGSRAASLTSVVIAQMYASPFNDDKKLLIFSDSVQDAAHRAGFFAGRTYRFNFRSALQQCVQAGGDGLRLDEMPEHFIRHWSGRMGPNAFIATFLAPNMAWFHEYEALKATGRLPAGGSLQRDVEQRIGWEIYAEYGFNCRIGRTLEKTGSSVAHPDGGLVDDVTAAGLDQLRNEIGGLRALAEPLLKRFITGVLVHLKQRGGLYHPALKAYIEDMGNPFRINRIPWMPNFGIISRTPAFLTTKRAGRFDRLMSPGTRRNTWYETWADKCFAPIYPLLREIIPSIYEIVLKALTRGGLLQETHVNGERVWGILPEAMRVHKEVLHLRCRACGHEIAVPLREKELWEGAPCLRFQCEGAYAAMAPEVDYYGKLYGSGDVYRIFAEEHTGLLDRDSREDLERRFKKKNRDPWDPNLLSCTPTLEMGIDIGDLSTVILCSVPPAQANYLQRVGRAGRRDGNALNLAVANARPHDLYFFADPREMIESEVSPPGVFLNASAVLERQFTAFCMDRWVETGIRETALPAQLRNVLGNLGTVDPQKFPHNLIAFINAHRTALFNRFTVLFADSLSEDSVNHIKTFAEGGRDSDGSLTYRIVNGLHHLFKERESLKSKVKSLAAKIRKKKESPIKDKNHLQELEELVREKNALQALVTRINDRATLNFFADEGLIPNYAFPEAGVVLRSMIYRRKEVQREGQSRYETFTFDYERPAVSAISELAPANKFYAGGRRVMVDQIDLSVSEIETWRFCTQCSFHEMDTQASCKSACPHCGSPLWADAGQKRQMVRMRQVFATTADRESRIGDDNDDRDPSFYNKQMMIRYNEADITDAFCIDSDEFPFGFEFLKRVSLREVNFGEKGELGENVVIAGVESRRKGFVICKFCGKVQNRKNEIQHALWCPARKKDDENNLSECVYLYREFSSEAVLILLPISTFEGSERKLHSFVAALHMGLKQTFGGSIDHLQTALHEEPAANSKYRKKYLVLYDTVPGGTGYLKQLMRSEAPLFAVFEKALETLSACPCNQDPAKDGCYRCLFAYRRSYTMGGTSREAAKSLLSEILKHRARLVRTGSLKGVRVNALFDSELEARFVEALRRVRVDDMPARLTKEVVNGKPGYFYRIGRKAYYIELQVPLGASVGVTVPSRADFVFRPARIQDGTRPVAVFTDGFYYHKDRVGLDMAQRTSIARSANFHVWSLSWKDIENRYKDQGGYFHNYLSIDGNDRALKYSRMLDFLGAERIPKLNSTDSFDWLIRFLADPDVKRWRSHASVHSLLHLDMARFAGNAEKAGWAAKLKDHFPEEISEWIGDLEKPCLYGLFEPENDFIKLFVAIGQDHFKKGDFSGLHAACCLLDGPTEREKQAFESAWNGYLRCYNLFQFLEKAFFSTWQGKASGQPHGKPKEWDDIKTESGSDAWREARELTDPKLHPFMDHLAAAGWAVPEIGFELVDPMGAVIAEAEFAWPELTICVLDAEQRIHGDAFSNAGWRVHEIEAVMAAPEGFTQEHEPDLK